MTKSIIEIVPVLLDVRSVHNVASVFRTANGVGVTEICTVGYTPGPHDRFGRLRNDFTKVSLGGEQDIIWNHYDSFEVFEESVRDEEADVVALEQAPQAVSYTAYVPKRKTYLLIGSETEGIAQEVLDKVDTVIEIPMYGSKESLNVAVATGIALYRLRENW